MFETIITQSAMKKILIVGAGGQIGSELVPHLRSIYGNNNVVAADISAEKCKVLAEAGNSQKIRYRHDF